MSRPAAWIFACALGLSLTATACGTSSTSVAAPLPRTSTVEWLDSDAQGMAVAQTERRPRFVTVHADWCPTCRNMRATVMSDPRVRAELARFVAVSLDVTEENGRTTTIRTKYDADALPALRIFDANGAPVASTDGKVDVEKLLAILRAVR